jgi:hypothetical protein
MGRQPGSGGFAQDAGDGRSSGLAQPLAGHDGLAFDGVTLGQQALPAAVTVNDDATLPQNRREQGRVRPADPFHNRHIDLASDLVLRLRRKVLRIQRPVRFERDQDVKVGL